jgi:hypothetical protein
MKTMLLAGVMVVMASSAMAFEGHAAPEPQCVINDYDPPTNVRTQPNGVIVGNLNNGTEVRIVAATVAVLGLAETADAFTEAAAMAR